LVDIMSPPPPLMGPDLASMGIDTARPLVIVDVDEVLGLFMQGFGTYLEDRGLEFRLDKFALFQNIYRPGETTHLDIAEGRKHYDHFFLTASGDMPLAPGGVQALDVLSRRAGVVILTNAPGQARLARARWLGRHGLDYPLILNSGPKGPLASGLARQVAGPVAFVDDLISNLDSVAEHAPRIARFQHVADPRLQPLAPSKPDLHTRIDDWAALGAAIEAAIG
jgi:hypothetical protein